MTKTKWVLVALLAGTLVTAATLKRTMASNDQFVQNPDQHQHHQAQQQRRPPSDMPPLLADGATNPYAIPDLIAYEILLNSVALPTAVSEIDLLRVKILAEKTNLDPDKVGMLKTAAHAFRDRIISLDAQAKVIKDRDWPKPGPAALNELSALQKQKEAILSEVFNSLVKQLSNEEKE